VARTTDPSDATKPNAVAAVHYTTPDDDAEFDLAEIFRVLRRRIWVLLGCVLLVTSLALLVIFQLTPRYTATAQVLIDVRERKVTDLESVVSGLSPESSTIESQVEVIRSRSLTTRVIEDLQLDKDPEFNPDLRERGARARALSWVTNLIPGSVEVISEERLREREKAKVAEVFSEALKVSRVGRLSFVISIAFTSEDGEKAARIANALADLYLVGQLDAKFEGTRLATEWLDERLTPLREQLRESEKAVEIYRSEHNLVDSKGITVNEQQISEINRQLILARADLAEKKARFRRVNQLLQSGSDVESVAAVLASNVVIDLRQQQAELARKHAELASRYGELHPQMINVQAERKDLQRELEAEVNRIVANLENEAEVARSRGRSLANSLQELQREAAVHDQARIRLRELQREAAANRALFEPFLSRFKETREQQGIQQPDARIISRAAVPVGPSYPNKKQSAALALVMSVLLGLGTVFLLESLSDGFQTAHELEAALQLPHLVSIPELLKSDTTVEGDTLSPEDYILAKPLSHYGEAFRSLRAKLLLSDTPPKVILFTSSLPSEGKTTAVISMGRAAAQTGMRVLVIDLDLRKPAVAKSLGSKPEKGVVEYLAGQVALEEVLVLDEASGMQFLPIASRVADPPDFLGSEGMRGLLEKLKTDFELILLDSPPVLPVADAKVLSRIVDKVVLLVQWEKAPRGVVQDAVHALREFGADTAGVVFSRVDMKRYARYGYGDSDYYYSHYCDDGSTDQRTNGSADQRTNGSADQRTNGSADQRTNGSADRRIGGSADRRTNGPTDRRTDGPVDQWTNGPLDRRTDGSVDRRTGGSADRRIG
jgi:succinoglycan biosynthesis transport protein ExoP